MKLIYFFSNIISVSIALVTAGCAFTPPDSGKYGEQYGTVTTSNPKEIIFIHGMYMTPACWQQWQDYFTKAGYQVAIPAWPLHEKSISDQRSEEHLAQLGKLEFSQVVDHFRQIVKSRSKKPILVGHSMGGLVAQILLSEGIAEMAVAIDSAPPKGIIALNWSFLKSNWGVINPFANLDKPIVLSEADFSYAFLN